MIWLRRTPWRFFMEDTLLGEKDRPLFGKAKLFVHQIDQRLTSPIMGQVGAEQAGHVVDSAGPLPADVGRDDHVTPAWRRTSFSSKPWRIARASSTTSQGFVK